MIIALIQIHSYPGEVERNVSHGIELYRKAVEGGAKAVVFPELWTCGYYLETPAFLAAAEKDMEILARFRALAAEYQVLTILPVPQVIEGSLYIGLYVIERTGEVIAAYQKSFLWGREQNYFVHGKRRYDPVDTSIGRIGTLICYDIEFPEPARILALKGAQLIFVPSVWSIPALNRWNIQLPARALDNTVFIAGINNVGEGACGHTRVVGPFGNILADASGDQEEVLLADIDYAEINRIRGKIPYLAEYDPALTPGGLPLC